MSIRIATLNTWSLPGPLARHKRERMQAIGKVFRGLDLDLMAFQEVWTRASRAALIAEARRSGYAHVWHNPQTVGSGGLLVVSRLPFREARFEAFVARGFPERLRHMDYYSGKGFAKITVETREGPLVIIDTHLHANYARPGEPDEYLGVRAAQVIQIAAALADPTHPVVAAGDFNLEESEDAHRVLLGLTGLTDVAVALDRRQFTSPADNPYQRPGHVDRRIDYVFCRSGARLGIKPLSIERSFAERLEFDGEAAACSDHAGLVAEIDLAPADGGAVTPGAEALSLGAGLLEAGRAISDRRRQSQRTAAGGGLAAGLAALTGSRYAGRSRRRFLRNSLGLASGLGFAIFAGQATLSEWMIHQELAGYDFAERQLADLRRHG